MNLENSKPPSHIMEKKFKVLVPIGDLPLAHKRPDGKGYEGIMYNIWLKIKDRLKKKYEFQEYFEETANYDEKTRQVVKGEYDLVTLAPPCRQTAGASHPQAALSGRT